MAETPQNPRTLTHSQFLTGTALFEGGLLAVAFVLGWVLDVNPTGLLSWSWQDCLWGLLATLPMLLMLALCFLSRFKGVLAIRTFLRDLLGPLLVRCRLHDLFLLALLAGVCEEVLFRGLVYGWLAPINLPVAIFAATVLFGAAHAVTLVYGLLAGILGLYLTALLAFDPTPNLLIPIVAHTVYDFVAFLFVVRDYRSEVHARHQ
jgi:CAAX protease family protein